MLELQSYSLGDERVERYLDVFICSEEIAGGVDDAKGKGGGCTP